MRTGVNRKHTLVSVSLKIMWTGVNRQKILCEPLWTGTRNYVNRCEPWFTLTESLCRVLSFPLPLLFPSAGAAGHSFPEAMEVFCMHNDSHSGVSLICPSTSCLACKVNIMTNLHSSHWWQQEKCWACNFSGSNVVYLDLRRGICKHLVKENRKVMIHFVSPPKIGRFI